MINDINATISKIQSSLSIQDKGKFPAQVQSPPQGQLSFSSTSTEQREHCQAVTTLRSGRVIDLSPPPHDTSNDKETSPDTKEAEHIS